MDKERLLYLFKQWLSNKASNEEVAEMLACMKSPGSDEILKSLIEATLKEETSHSLHEEIVTEQAWRKMWTHIQDATTKPSHKKTSIVQNI